MSDIIIELESLIKQATTERSHFYVASCARKSIQTIEQLQDRIAALEGELAYATAELAFIEGDTE